MIYYLPIYFQAIDGVSPSESGVRNLPLILASCKSSWIPSPSSIILIALPAIFTLLSGQAIGRVGYFQPFLTFGAIFTTVGAGLLYTLNIGSSSAKYIGYQVVVGIGVGTCIQVPVIASQACSGMVDISTVTAVVLCKTASTLFCSTPQPLTGRQFSSSSPAPSLFPPRSPSSRIASLPPCPSTPQASMQRRSLPRARLNSVAPLLLNRYSGFCNPILRV